MFGLFGKKGGGGQMQSGSDGTNSWMYRGDTSNGRAHGKGQMTYTSGPVAGWVAIGTFANDKLMSGYMRDPDGDRWTVQNGSITGKS